MKKIMFNDKYGLTKAVLEGRKTMTKAEEAAIKAYPDNDVLFFAEDADGNTHPVTTFGREMNGFIFGYEQAEAETIERACKWLFAHLTIIVDYYNEDIHENADRSEFIKLFRKQMEEE